MTFLRTRYTRGEPSALAAVLLLVATGCSLTLDTDSLREGSNQAALNDAGESSETSDGFPSANSDSGIEPGATEGGSSDASQCNSATHEACADCAAVNCCTETTACTGDTRCNLALVQLTQCRRDVRRTSNSSAAIAACNTTFVQSGGSLASNLMTCMNTHCQPVCTS